MAAITGKGAIKSSTSSPIKFNFSSFNFSSIFDEDSVNKIKNGDLDEMEKVREELDRKNKIFNERFGIVSEEEAVEKIRTNLLNKEVNANNDLHNEIKNELNEEKIDNKEEKIKEEIEEKEIMKESDLLK